MKKEVSKSVFLVSLAILVAETVDALITETTESITAHKTESRIVSLKDTLTIISGNRAVFFYVMSGNNDVIQTITFDN